MGQIAKQCIICAQSCEGKPRIKDADGRYAHKACIEKKQQQKATTKPPSAVLDLSPESEPEMAAFLDDLPSIPEAEAPTGLRAACPGCGSSVAPDAMVCTSCGCNVRTGRGAKTKVAKAKSSKSKSGSGLGAKAGSLALAPILPIIGASIGGAIGAAIWLAVQIFTGYEIGLLAAGVGALCGIGAAIFSRGGNTWAGGVAVVVALISVFLGKIVIATLFIAGGDMLREQIQADMLEPLSADTISQDLIYEQLVVEIVQDHIDRNSPIDWRNDEDAEDPYWPYSYPDTIVAETQAHWESMIPEDQQAYKGQLAKQLNVDILEWNRELEEELASLDDFKLSELFTFWDILWAFLAIGAAWRFGNGEE